MSRAVIVVAGVAAFAVGLGAWMLSASPNDTDETPAEVRSRTGERREPHDGAAAPAARGDLEGRVAQLEDEVAQLRREMQRRRMVQGAAAARGADLDPDGSNDGAESPEFEGVVRDIIETEREEARERRTEAMQERFSERHGELLDQLVTVAGINKSERQSIETLWETESEQLVPLFMAGREGERPFSEIREEAEKLRNATDTSVEEMLTPEQFEQYKELRPGPPGRRGGGPP